MPVSLNSALSAARSALMSNQAAMQVVSDNIANATTIGYTRKRAEIAPGPTQILPEGVFGTGVVVRNVTQARDRFLDGSYRDASSSRQQQQVRYEYLDQIESALGEPDAGISSTLDSFFNSWSDLANDPLNQSARGVIRERALQLTAQVKRFWNSLDSIGTSALRRLGTEVQQVNGLTARIAQLNEQIVAAESGGQSAGTLRDDRNLAIDELAGMAAVQVTERDNGAVAVAFEGLTLVDGSGSTELRAPVTAGGVTRIRTANGAELTPSAGSLAGYLGVLNRDLADFRNQLNTLVSDIISAVNTAHADGVNAAGFKGDFFEPVADPQYAASSFDLASAIKADARAIAAGSGGALIDPLTGRYEYLSGRNDIANRIAGLRSEGSVVGAYRDFVSDIGIRTNAASDNARAQASLAGHAANLRDSFMGVSTDEEMVELIRLQKAYGAAARVVTTVDEMMQTLLELKR